MCTFRLGVGAAVLEVLERLKTTAEVYQHIN